MLRDVSRGWERKKIVEKNKQKTKRKIKITLKLFMEQELPWEVPGSPWLGLCTFTAEPRFTACKPG